jgi:hypothetical protein
VPRIRPLAVLAVLPLLAVAVATGGAGHAATTTSASVARVPKAATAAKPCRIADAKASHANRPPSIPPRKKAYFGGYSLGDGASPTDTAGSFQAFQNKACRRVDVAHVYVSWAKNFPPDRFTTQAAAAGKVILLSWAAGDMAQMASGATDAKIRAMADSVKAFGYPVLFEFRWEMDIPNNADQVHSPADFIKAWKRSRRIFNEQGVKNASWVWCPSGIGFAKGWAQQYYPGNSEVDWVCTDAYIDYRFAPETTYQPPSELLRSFIRWLHRHHKPAIIGEFGVPSTYSTAWRVKWLRQMRSYVKSHRRIKAVVYFDHKPAGAPASHDTSLGSNPQVLAAFKAFGQDQYFRPKDRADPTPSR